MTDERLNNLISTVRSHRQTGIGIIGEEIDLMLPALEIMKQKTDEQKKMIDGFAQTLINVYCKGCNVKDHMIRCEGCKMSGVIEQLKKASGGD